MTDMDVEMEMNMNVDMDVGTDPGMPLLERKRVPQDVVAPRERGQHMHRAERDEGQGSRCRDDEELDLRDDIRALLCRVSALLVDMQVDMSRSVALRKSLRLAMLFRTLHYSGTFEDVRDRQESGE